MKYLPFLLLLASCAPFAPRPTAPVSEPIRLATAFDGHPPVEVMDLEATPDSIATVVAEYYYRQAKQAKKPSLVRAWLLSVLF